MGEGVPTLAGGKRYLPRMGGGVPVLNRLCRRQYASCGFLQEEFRVPILVLDLAELNELD